jgi:hypothetical protein
MGLTVRSIERPAPPQRIPPGTVELRLTTARRKRFWAARTGRMMRPKENKVSDGGRERASLGVKV